MERQIKDSIDKIERITEYIGMFVTWIFLYVGIKQQNNIYITIAITTGVYRLLILIILFCIENKVHNSFWQEKLREFNEREED